LPTTAEACVEPLQLVEMSQFLKQAHGCESIWKQFGTVLYPVAHSEHVIGSYLAGHLSHLSPCQKASHSQKQPIALVPPTGTPR
jgi:hypothetical protein